MFDVSIPCSGPFRNKSPSRIDKRFFENIHGKVGPLSSKTHENEIGYMPGLVFTPVTANNGGK